MTSPAHPEQARAHDFSHNSGLAHPRTGHTARAPSDLQGIADDKVSILVPYRESDPRRKELWDWCKAYWTANFPEYELIECDSRDKVFTRGRSINEGFEKSTGQILILADADTLVGHIEEAVSMACRGDWVIAYPQGRYCALTELATNNLLAVHPSLPIREPTADQCRQQITSYSGCLVMPRDAFYKVDGFDPRFVSWGHEDFAFMFALDTLWKPHQRASGWAMHLYHEHIEEERFQQPHIAINKAIADSYEHCYGNPSAMMRLIRER